MLGTRRLHGISCSWEGLGNLEPTSGELLADIFLSYARADVERAGAIAAALEEHGWSVFWDTAILPGQRWRDVIHGELAAASCVVVIWSEGSSKSNWVVEEASEALQSGKLLPVLVDDVEPPFGFRTVEAADLRTWEPGAVDHPGFEVLADAIGGLLAVPASAGPGSAEEGEGGLVGLSPEIPGVAAADEDPAPSQVPDDAAEAAAVARAAPLEDVVAESADDDDMDVDQPSDDDDESEQARDPSREAGRDGMAGDSARPANDLVRPAEPSAVSRGRPIDTRPPGAPVVQTQPDDAFPTGPAAPPAAPHRPDHEHEAAAATSQQGPAPSAEPFVSSAAAPSATTQVPGPTIPMRWLAIAAVIVVALVLVVVFTGNGAGDPEAGPVASSPVDQGGGDTAGNQDGDGTTPSVAEAVGFAPDIVDAERLVAERAPGPMTIDGSPDDWVGVTTAYALQHTVSGPPQVETRLGADSPGIMAVAYDDSRLYVFAVVDDDVYSQPNQGNQVWRGDALDINISTVPAGERPRKPDGQTFQLTMTPLSEPTGQPDNVLFVGNGDAFDENTTSLPVTLSGSVEPSGRWILEAGIPWAVFGLAGPPGNSPFAALFSVFDNDGETSGGQSVQTVILGHLPGASFQEDVLTWGRFDIER